MLKLNTFNILICGQFGEGKNTFINNFIHEKVAKEGECLYVTHKIKSYIHPKYRIRIYDNSGLKMIIQLKYVKIL